MPSERSAEIVCVVLQEGAEPCSGWFAVTPWQRTLFEFDEHVSSESSASPEVCLLTSVQGSRDHD
jgi:hypothetical protein